MNSKINFEDYIERYINGTLTEYEKLQLESALNDSNNIEKLALLIKETYDANAEEKFEYEEKKVDEMIRSILKQSTFHAAPLTVSNNENSGASLPGEQQNTLLEDETVPGKELRRFNLFKPGWVRYVAAAVFAGALGLYIYSTSNTSHNEEVIKQVAQQTFNDKDAMPGSNKAVLTLSNGQKVILNDSGQEVITDDGVYINNDNGTLSYSESDIVAQNTMTTPRGGQYKLTLPDGTKVWLNAASSITYPTSFAGDKREVSITGEAYFEVTKNPSKPFTVKTYKDEITVKGTSFNVNSYADESAIKTSLLEGLVEINKTLLKPGNAYVDGEIITADLDKELAWKNGVFNFHHVKLKDAMRQIARWYDIDIRYEGNNVDVELGGEIGRNLTLQQVLNGLQDKDIHFRLEEKVLTVYQ